MSHASDRNAEVVQAGHLYGQGLQWIGPLTQGPPVVWWHTFVLVWESSLYQWAQCQLVSGLTHNVMIPKLGRGLQGTDLLMVILSECAKPYLVSESLGSLFSSFVGDVCVKVSARSFTWVFTSFLWASNAESTNLLLGSTWLSSLGCCPLPHRQL